MVPQHHIFWHSVPESLHSVQINEFLSLRKFHNQYKHLIQQCKKLSAQGNFQHLPITARGLALAEPRTSRVVGIFWWWWSTRLWRPEKVVYPGGFNCLEYRMRVAAGWTYKLQVLIYRWHHLFGSKLAVSYLLAQLTDTIHTGKS